MLDAGLVYLAIGLRLTSGLTYALAVFRGQARPNNVTWFFWGASPIIAFAAQAQTTGLSPQAWMTLALGLGPLVIFMTSLIKNKGIWRFNKSDIICAIF